jgi:type VI protein secretion system component VasF
MDSIEHEVAKATKLISQAHSASDARRSMELGQRAMVELLSALLVEVGKLREQQERANGDATATGRAENGQAGKKAINRSGDLR